MGWLKQLQERMDAIDLDGVKGPEDPVAENEQVLGEAHDEAKRLWVLRKRLHREARQLAAKIVHAHIADEEHDDVNCSEWNKQVTEIERECEHIDALFWTSLLDQFAEQVLDGNLGIRANWQVVTMGNKPSNGEESDEIPKEIKDIIRSLGGDPAKVKIVREETVLVPSGFGRR